MTLANYLHSLPKIILIFLCSMLVYNISNAQSFSKVTDPLNPVVTDQLPLDYSGSAWFDYDGDSLIDLVVTGVGKNFLYHNDGGGMFSVPSGNPISADLSKHRGVSCGDYDNDGDPDVFMTGSSGGKLYRNDNGLFVLVSSVDLGTSDTRGWSPAWADYDNDGNLDLFIGFPAGFVNLPDRSNRLLHNLGAPNYTFELIDTTEITSVLAPFTSGNWSDYDMDGDLDLFIGSGPASNFVAPDYIYKNLLTENGVVSFERITTGAFATDNADGQVFNIIDYDNDGDFDIHRTNWSGAAGLANRRNDLYRNDSGTYVEITTGTIVTDQQISLAGLWEDFDNDGDLDCYVANSGQDKFYTNNNDGTFTSTLAGAIGIGSLVHTGASAGDYDNDGDLDIFAVGKNSERTLFRNDNANGNGWIKIKLIGDISNTDAIGSKVRVKANINGTDVWQIREISTQNSFLGHSSIIVHFGLGDASQIDSLEVLWTSGIVTILENVTINQYMEIVEFCEDPDMDGITSCFDNCPADSNGNQLDSDGDGIGDVCDVCPNDADNDIDGDSVCGDVDNCPTTYNPDQLDSDSDGVGDVCDGCCLFNRGNVDSDNSDIVDISDLVYLVDFMFNAGPTPLCTDEANVDADSGGLIDISDLVTLVDFMFNGGPTPAICP